MKAALIAIALVADSLLCLCGFVWLAFIKGIRVSEATDSTVGLVVLVSSMMVPVLGIVSLSGARGTVSYRVL